MIRKIGLFLASGLLWLALFSIPVKNGVSIYELGRYYLIDTRLVRWSTAKIDDAFTLTKESAIETADKIVEPLEPGTRAAGEALERLSESVPSLGEAE